MRNYTINASNERTATIRNLYNGDEFTTAFPHSEFELDNIQDRATTYGLHDYECGYMPSELPGWISCHIDWEGVGRELSFDGYSEINGGVLYVAQ